MYIRWNVFGEAYMYACISAYAYVISTFRRVSWVAVAKRKEGNGVAPLIHSYTDLGI